MGGTLGVGYLLQPDAPHWTRWFMLAALQVALGAVSARAPGDHAGAGRQVAHKLILWPVITAGLAGAARLAGHEIYLHLEWLAVLSLAVAHGLVEWLTRAHAALSPLTPQSRGSRPSDSPRWVRWLSDMRWGLAIAGVPWSWDLIPAARLAGMVVAGALFLWVVRPRAAVPCD
jgi:hypothetical protein